MTGNGINQPADRRDVETVRRRCTRFLSGHGSARPHDVLTRLAAGVAPDEEADRYGEGRLVESLERGVADLLGKPAAVFMPSGTMAQQVALRVHADRRQRRTVIFHPLCHLEQHEHRAYAHLHGLHGRTTGSAHELLRLSDLEAVTEPVAALLLELPQRSIGGRLPTWDELVAQTGWARSRGAAVHMDGARLWESGPYYGRSYAEIAALFDTVYVSFYKGLGGIAGCCLAGPADVVAEARVWQARHGGVLFGMYPHLLAATDGLRRRLPRMPAYRDRALALAAALRPLPGVEIVPDPPQVSMMHLLLRTDEESLRATVLDIAEETGIWTFRESEPTTSPRWRQVELSVGDATLELSVEEVRRIVDRLAAPGR